MTARKKNHVDHKAQIDWSVNMPEFADDQRGGLDADRRLSWPVCMMLPDRFRLFGHSQIRLRRPRQTGVRYPQGPGLDVRQHGGTMTDQTGQAPGALPPRRLRVVIVEDEAIVAMELELLFEDMDTDVLGIATSAAEACALVQLHQPDFVTMDISIKGDRDGVSAALEIFEAFGVRSIFISSYSDPATQKRAQACQAIAWIRKPVDTVDLVAAVRLVRRRGD